MINYSDGTDVETKIQEILRVSSDLNSCTAIAHQEYSEWAVRYHLSPERSVLLRHLDFSNMNVLELGAGMGGVSRYLAESAKSLTVVEGTERRFTALSERLRDLKNWKGTVCNIQDFETDEKFDIVCVIGVLEYSEFFIQPDRSLNLSPFDCFIRKALGFLKPEGCLVLAIENELGLKYWSGAGEDHTGLLFDGLTGYGLGASAKTFSRAELLEMLQKAGHHSVDFYYPFPDYKVPHAVLSDSLIQDDSELAADIAVHQRFENYGQPRVHLFPDILALPVLARAKLFKEFSNSFLIISSFSNGSSIKRALQSREIMDSEIGWHYSLLRKVPTRTVFFHKEGSDKRVHARKEPLFTARHTEKEYEFEHGNVRVQWRSIKPDARITGAKLLQILATLAYRRRWQQFLEELEKFISWSLDYWKADAAIAPGLLRGEALDAIVINVKKSEDPSDPLIYRFFDLEWSLYSPFSRSWFVLRNVLSLSRIMHLFTDAPFGTLEGLYRHLCERMGLKPDIERDLLSEFHFQGAVRELHGTPETAEFEYMKANLAHVRLQFPSTQGGMVISPESIASIHSLNEFRTGLDRSNRENNELRATVSALRANLSAVQAERERLAGLLGSFPHRFAEKVNAVMGHFPALRKLIKKVLLFGR